MIFNGFVIAVASLLVAVRPLLVAVLFLLVVANHEAVSVLFLHVAVKKTVISFLIFIIAVFLILICFSRFHVAVVVKHIAARSKLNAQFISVTALCPKHVAVSSKHVAAFSKHIAVFALLMTKSLWDVATLVFLVVLLHRTPADFLSATVFLFTVIGFQ